MEMRITTHFPHSRLQAYQVALEMAVAAKALSDRVPRGFRSFADQILRSAGSTVAQISEGANRRTAAEKRNAFGRARGEAGETAAHAELLATLGVVPEADAERVMLLADRVAAMLTKLIRRQS
ncbi:MAG: four helix bundle protein [Deltaproteobacteria bacterium]|nr:four helix bundle protein [Deltaproteobacteria bacterium]